MAKEADGVAHTLRIKLDQQMDILGAGSLAASIAFGKPNASSRVPSPQAPVQGMHHHLPNEPVFVIRGFCAWKEALYWVLS